MNNNKLTVILLSVMLVAGIAQAQFYVGVQGGLGFSSFEEQDKGATAVPLGITVGTDLLPILDAGLEANFLASPYKFDFVDITSATTLEQKVSQTFYGAYVRWYFLPLPAISPYLRGGAAYYSGKIKTEGRDDLDLKGSIGFNIGGGVDLLMGLYAEAVYHIVSLEADVADSEKKGFNSIQVTVGYNFDLL